MGAKGPIGKQSHTLLFVQNAAVLDLTSLEENLDVAFKNRELLEQALVHRSYLNENPDFRLGSNERLEYLGDALIALATAHELYVRNPELPEGDLTALRAALVSGEALAQVGESLKLGPALYLGQGEERSGGRQRTSNLAGVFEAVVGALFIDQGYQVSGGLVIRCLSPQMDELLAKGILRDFKSRLQELVQGRGHSSPSYQTVDASGPDHDRLFTVEVLVEGEVKGRGKGRRKTEAEQRAAEDALAALQ